MNFIDRRNRESRVRGFTWIELAVVIAIIGILLALLLPSVRTSRGAARRVQCKNNLKQLGLALHNYHHTHGYLPAAMGGTGLGSTPDQGNANRLSGVVVLLPFLDQPQLWRQISTPTEFNGIDYPAMGPAPWVSAYPPWRETLYELQCPSANAEPSTFGSTNYAFCIGDTARRIHDPQHQRGVFACGRNTRFQDIVDGTSNTIAMAEIGTRSNLAVWGQFAIDQPLAILGNPGLCRQTLESPDGRYYANDTELSADGRGGRWADGAAGYSLVNTILPPNSPSCAVGEGEAVDGIYSAGSAHEGGVQVLKADGSVRFISNEIDAGDPNHPAPSPEQFGDGPLASPYGVWGALGTVAGEDIAEMAE